MRLQGIFAETRPVKIAISAIIECVCSTRIYCVGMPCPRWGVVRIEAALPILPSIVGFVEPGSTLTKDPTTQFCVIR